MSRKDRRKGFTLVEVLVAIVIVGLVLTAVAAVISSSVSNSSQADYRQTASGLAQEGIEAFRQKRSELGWSSFYATYGSTGSQMYCIDSNNMPTAIQNDCNGYPVSRSATTFNREVTIENLDSPERIKVTVRVAWKDGSSDRDVEVSQIFFDY